MHKFTVMAILVFALSIFSPWASTAQASPLEDVLTQFLTQSSNTPYLADFQQLTAYIQQADKEALLSQLTQAVIEQYLPNAGLVSGMNREMLSTALNERVSQFLVQYQDELETIDAFLDGRDANLLALIGSFGQALADDLETAENNN